MKYFQLLLCFLCISVISSSDTFLSLEEIEDTSNREKRSLSSKGLNLIKSFESLQLTAYQDSTGKWTIGYGHTEGVSKGMKISQQQADAYLKSDVSKFEGNVNKQSMKFDPNQNEFDALVSFTFNLGNSNLAMLVKDRSKAQVADAILLYNKAGGKVLPGLVKRREAERSLFLS